MTYRDFVDYVKSSARQVGTFFTEPDDDWEPVALLETKEGEMVIVSLAMDKQLWPKAISEMVEQAGIVKVALVTSSWGLEFETPEEYEAYMENDEPSPSKHPNGFEMLVLSIFDQERVEAWSARIQRHDDEPPTLDEWDWGGTEPDGRMIEPIREAMR